MASTELTDSHSTSADKLWVVPWPSALVLTPLVPDFSESSFGIVPHLLTAAYKWLIAAEVSYNLLH